MLAELEAQIAEDPFDDTRWSVLDDWLLDQDEPRAEIVRAEQTGDPSAVAAAYRRLAPVLFGERHESLARYVTSCTWRSGFARSLTLDPLDWPRIDDIVATPAMSLLRELTLEHPFASAPTRSADDVLAAIALAPCRRSLRSLTVSSYALFSASSLAPLQIDRLTIDPRLSSTLEYDPALARLRSLAIMPRTRMVLAALFRGVAFPELRELELTWNPEPLFAWTNDDLAPILSAAATPRLERLVVHLPPSEYERSRALVRLIDRSPLGARLAWHEIHPRMD